MTTGNSLKQAWAAGRKTFGVWLTIPSSLSAEFVAEARPDYVCVDQQHGAVDYGSMVPMLQAIRAAGATPITRVVGNDAALIMKALDAGALGVIVPLVSSAAEAARAVAACRYPPTGARSYGPVRAAHVLGSTSPSDLADGVVCLVMVETREGLDGVEEIAATPGLDGIYVGPADLALSLGLAPSFDSVEPEHVEGIRRVREACATNGIVAGIHCGSGAHARQRAAEGFDMMTVGSEAALMVDGVRRELREAGGGEVGRPARTTAGYS